MFSLFLLFLTFQINLFSQDMSNLFKERGEAIIKIRVQNPSDIAALSKIVSVDKIEGSDVIAYVNEKEFLRFLKTGFDYEVVPRKAPENVKMSYSVKDAMTWDNYPSYDTYVQLMYNFENMYPYLCRIYDAGTTVEGRHILFAVISDHVNEREPEPQFMYTATMHGDETAGYVLMLHLIDYLLSNYRSDAEIRNLVNNMEIWINPLANPDGTFAGGNDNVWGSTRYNANWVDLNRNFPDPEDGPHPDGESYQPETQAMMTLAEANNFIMSANFHGGAEVVNYPWDTWQRRHPDDAWFQLISREYADSCHANSPYGYMTDLDDGITNGYDWYSIAGGRQDYMNYFRHCREVTIELSSTKTLPASELLDHWNYNRAAFLHYMKQAMYGLQGVVTDSLTGEPIVAKITVVGHDADGSEVYSDTTGRYSRPIKAGTYTVKVEAENYYTKTFENVEVTDFETTELNVELVNVFVDVEDGTSPVKFALAQNYPNPFNPTTMIKYSIPNMGGVETLFTESGGHATSLQIYNVLGEEIATLVNEKQSPGNYTVQFNASNLPSGVYFYTLRVGDFVVTKKMILLK